MSLTSKDIVLGLGASMQAACARMTEMADEIARLRETNQALVARLAQAGVAVERERYQAEDDVLEAAEAWEEMWDSLRESGLEPVLCPEEEKLDRAVRALREAMSEVHTTLCPPGVCADCDHARVVRAAKKGARP